MRTRAAELWRTQRIPIIVGLAWISLVVFAWNVSQRTGVTIPTCLFRRFTGQPCATCGGTRAAMRLFHADVPGAWAFNPLVTVLLLALPAWIVWRVARGGRPATPISRRARAVWGAVWLAALAANWVYVVRHERALQLQTAPAPSP